MEHYISKDPRRPLRPIRLGTMGVDASASSFDSKPSRTPSDSFTTGLGSPVWQASHKGCHKEPSSLLSEAVMKCDAAAVSSLLHQRAAAGDLTHREPETLMTPLHIAACTGSKTIMALLLAAGAHKNAQDAQGLTPLHHATRLGHERAAALLLEHGANPNALSAAQYTPVHLACRLASPAILRQLIRCRGRRDARTKDTLSTPLHLAVLSGRDDMLRCLLEEPGTDFDVDATDGYGYTALHRAAQSGKPRMAAMLVRHNASMSYRGRWDWTALHWAANSGHVEVVVALLVAGADPSIADTDGSTASDVAATDDLRRLLLSAGEGPLPGSAPSPQRCPAEEPRTPPAAAEAPLRRAAPSPAADSCPGGAAERRKSEACRGGGAASPLGDSRREGSHVPCEVGGPCLAAPPLPCCPARSRPKAASSAGPPQRPPAQPQRAPRASRHPSRCGRKGGGPVPWLTLSWLSSDEDSDLDEAGPAPPMPPSSPVPASPGSSEPTAADSPASAATVRYGPSEREAGRLWAPGSPTSPLALRAPEDEAASAALGALRSSWTAGGAPGLRAPPAGAPRSSARAAHGRWGLRDGSPSSLMPGDSAVLLCCGPTALDGSSRCVSFGGAGAAGAGAAQEAKELVAFEALADRIAGRCE
eukprot:CAMPEP_0177586172 /NCGR_PEP_ID=MMETSP0419_2-20121207/4921_1 /TAXON_ID=582737 /ORGANISM="Tetraselmis sp., Strain GSL018" /LENGTH=644 /DNA_ID=CAMNT_0019076027 /DNA_START=412 /DNA_END=2344 /DNA_ORIENTATION=+